MKVSGNGTLLWVKAYGGPGWDAAYGVGVDTAGNIFVTGENSTSADNNDETQVFVTKLDPNGNIIWQAFLDTAAFNATTTSIERTNALAVDTDGNPVRPLICFRKKKKKKKKKKETKKRKH